MSETHPEINVQGIMERVRQRAREVAQREETALRQARKLLPRELLARSSRFSSQVGVIRASVPQLGELPPEPPSFRGRLGGFAVRLVRRALFWLIPSLQLMHDRLAEALEHQARINEELIKAVEQAHLHVELLALRSSGAAGPPVQPPDRKAEE
jgi:hypothetical protein